MRQVPAEEESTRTIKLGATVSSQTDGATLSSDDVGRETGISMDRAKGQSGGWRSSEA